MFGEAHYMLVCSKYNTSLKKNDLFCIFLLKSIKNNNLQITSDTEICPFLQHAHPNLAQVIVVAFHFLHLN